MFGVTATRVYTVHLPTKPARGIDQAVFVREGFAWGAFLFSALWALWHRMWFAALLMLAAVVGAGLAADIVDLDPAVQALVGILLGLYFGFEANDWYRAALSRRGFREAGVVVAPSLIEAEHRWFARHFASAPGMPS